MPENIVNLLKEAKTIAIVGCSDKKYRTSYHIAEYMQENGYRIIPVNPNYDEILGEKVYPSVDEIPEEITIDIVDIFRDPAHTAEMVQDVIRRVRNTGKKPIVWTQLGVSSAEAKKLAENEGLTYIEEKCMMVEHSRNMG